MMIIRPAVMLLSLLLTSDPRPAFDFDIKSGLFDTWAITDVGPVTGANIDFEIREVRHDPKWRATFAFEVNDGTLDPKARQFAVVQFTDAGGSGLQAFVNTGRGDEPGKRIDAGFSIQPRNRLTMAMDWSGVRHLKVTVAGHVVDVRLDFDPRGFQVGASTGRIIGHSLKLLGPEPQRGPS
jgi:hypothetical protein